MHEDDAAQALPGNDVTHPFALNLDSVAELFQLHDAQPMEDPLLGIDVGGVTLVRLIGEGGMGRVYEGLQDRPRRPVAVKIMRPGFASRETYRRFLREAEILGKLRHPGISQIYAAGVCPVAGAKVPFFLMELIPNARSITDYAVGNRLSLRDRLSMMRLVCDAVAHGHDLGIVHRDLKPGNILVDPAGHPKVIDFGVARMDDDAKPPMTALTEAGRMIGTLQYMSPEQLSVSADGIDGRADIYSLGVVFHELLTGRLPYEVTQRAIFDAVRIIMQHVPESPPQGHAGMDRCLFDIVSKCLKKEPSRRYGSVRELSDSLGRYLTTSDGSSISDSSRLTRVLPRIGSWSSALGLLFALAAGAWWMVSSTDGNIPTTAGTPGPVSKTAADDGHLNDHVASIAGIAIEQRDGGLHVADATVLSPGQAEALVAHAKPLDLPSIERLDVDVATILSRTSGKLSLNKLKRVSPDVASHLARQRGTLCLDGLLSLDAESALALAQHDGWLNLGGLGDVPHEALDELVSHQGGLAINLPGPLTHERAEIISRHSGQLYVLGVESVDGPAAELLARHADALALDTKTLAPDAEEVLKRHPHVYQFHNR